MSQSSLLEGLFPEIFSWSTKVIQFFFSSRIILSCNILQHGSAAERNGDKLHLTLICNILLCRFWAIFYLLGGDCCNQTRWICLQDQGYSPQNFLSYHNRKGRFVKTKRNQAQNYKPNYKTGKNVFFCSVKLQDIEDTPCKFYLKAGSVIDKNVSCTRFIYLGKCTISENTMQVHFLSIGITQICKSSQWQ